MTSGGQPAPGMLHQCLLRYGQRQSMIEGDRFMAEDPSFIAYSIQHCCIYIGSVILTCNLSLPCFSIIIHSRFKMNLSTKASDYQKIWEEQHQARIKGLNFLEETNPKFRAMLTERLEHLNPMMSISYYPHALKLKDASGVYMMQQNGQVNLDCINNVSHIGHCHPRYVHNLQVQAGTLNTNSRFIYDPLNNAMEKLLKKFPEELSVVTFCNSGSEANDIAMQMAEIYTGKKGVICLEAAYHGVTKACMDVSPYKWNQHYPVPSHVAIAKTPCTYRGQFAKDPNFSKKYAEYIDSIVKEDTGAFIAELMQSCAGQVIPPQDLYKQVYDVLRKKGVVVIADEVQTGFGRLGSHFWCFQHYGVVPDIVVMGKAMGNGLPISAVVCRKEIANAFRDRGIEFFSTYGGNPMASIACESVLDVIEAENLQENAYKTGQYLKQKLHDLLSLPFVGDVRGVGLFQGIQIVKDKQSKQHDGELAKRIIMKAREYGVLLSRDGVHHNIIKIKPPVVFNVENVDQLMKVLSIVMKQVSD